MLCYTWHWVWQLQSRGWWEVVVQFRRVCRIGQGCNWLGIKFIQFMSWFWSDWLDFTIGDRGYWGWLCSCCLCHNVLIRRWVPIVLRLSRLQWIWIRLYIMYGCYQVRWRAVAFHNQAMYLSARISMFFISHGLFNMISLHS